MSTFIHLSSASFLTFNTLSLLLFICTSLVGAKQDLNSLKVSNFILDDTIESSRIIGGHEVEKNAYPFMTRISTLWKNSGKRVLCGGTLIHNQFVLTAAHCVIDIKKNDIFQSVTVYLGDHDRLNYDLTEIEMDIEEVIIHDNYYKKSSSDIALLRLASPIQPNAAIGLACLTSSGREYIGYNATVLGWGLTSTSNDIPSSYLKETAIPILKDYRCNMVPKYDPADMICTGFIGKSGENTVYKGDSGGPLFIKDEEEKITVVGVASFVYLKGGLTPKVSAGIFTKISVYSEWIQYHLGSDKNICFNA